MEVTWEFKENQIVFSATAPDDGWVAIGFNSENSIVGSNLYMMNVTSSGVEAADLFVVAAGNPRPVSELGSKPQIMEYSGSETNGSTKIQFSLPINAIDKYHFDLKKGEKIWLICAYSMEDEFDHHSRMRKHVQVSL